MGTVITVLAQGKVAVAGLEPAEREPAMDPIRQAEVASIRRFVASKRDLLRGRVLDFGAGKAGTCREPQPYRDLVSADAVYLPYDVGDELPRPPFDAILCTQVLQYIDNAAEQLFTFWAHLHPGGTLILTYATNWDECERTDFVRYTKAGMDRMLHHSGFTVESHERRAEVKIGNFTFPLGYGVVAVAR